MNLVARLEWTFPPRVRKVLGYAAYPAFYLLCLALSAYYAFPYERLKRRVITEYEASRAAAGTPETLEIGSLGPYWFSGLQAKDVRLVRPPSPTEIDGKPTRIELDEVHVRLSILPLLIGRASLGFGGKAFGGTFSGATRQSGPDRAFELELDAIDLGEVSPVTAAIGAPLTGKTTGKIELVMADQKLAKATGTIDLTVQDVAVGDGKTKIQGKLALPKLSLGDLTISAEAKDGVLRLSRMAAAGHDLDLAGEGKLTLRDPVGDSLCDLYFRFRFADVYKNRSDVTRSLFGAPGSAVPALFELADPRIKASKRPDGFYGWHMVGPLKDARYDAAPSSPSGAAVGGAPRVK